MTDISIRTPKAIFSWSLPRLKFPKFAIGTALANTSEAIREAFEMAYVAPFSAMQRGPSIVRDEDIEGRDPNW